MRKWSWAPVLLALVPLGCSSTSKNEGGGAAGANSGGSGGASSGGAGGASGACTFGTADCDEAQAGCEQSLHCIGCNFPTLACQNAFTECLGVNACACDSACMHECARVKGPKDDPVLVQSCRATCGASNPATLVLECELKENLDCCFN